ncbi:MAG: SurA N-terminal domain-containing protein [Myxococcaceae bacterium]|nr:SurA N-terminal domain-containing protein [Myxococcaceae bacterium]
MNVDSTTRRITTLLFIVAIAVVFTLQFGPGSQGCAVRKDVTGSAAAVVNGREIPGTDLARAYQLQLQRFQGQGIPAELLQQLVPPQRVLDSMIDNELLAQAAERRGIVATDEEMRETLRAFPLFHDEQGRFDPKLYRQNVPGFMGKSVADFETELRRDLSAQKMQELVASGALVSDDEVKARFLKEGNSANVTFVRFLPAMFADKVPNPTPAQLAEFRKANEAAIKAQYEQNRFAYSTPERVKARQIVVQVPANATAEQKAAAMQKAEQLRKDVVDGKQDFAQVASASSDDAATRAKGGELGWVDRGAWVPAVADAAFALQPGEVTQPVEGPTGIYLVKVEEKKPAETKPLEQVADEIATQLYKKDKAQALARTAADQALAQVRAGKSLKELYPAPTPAEGQQLPAFETENKPQARESGVFNAATPAVPGLGPAPELTKDVFASETARVLPTVYPVGEALVVAQVTERKRPTDADFEQQKEALRAQARQAKQFELTDTFVKELRKGGNVKVNEEAVAAAVGR